MKEMSSAGKLSMSRRLSVCAWSLTTMADSGAEGKLSAPLTLCQKTGNYRLIKVASKMARYRVNLQQHDVNREGKVINNSLPQHSLPNFDDTSEQRNANDDLPRRT
jgi:hypothetical protein